MCDGASEMFIASMVITAATTAASMKAQADQANAVNQSNQQQRTLIDANRQQQVLQAQRQEYYVNQEAEQKLDQNAQASRAARATADVAAGESGISGLSVDALQREYFTRGSEYAQDVDFNRNADTDQIQTQMRGFNSNAMSQQARLPVPTPPSFVDAALRIGGGAVSAYDKYLYTPQPKSKLDVAS